jgi:hypothetical protein
MTSKSNRLKSERGAELIEFALIFPLLLLVVLGIIDFGFTFQRYEVLTNAAREGARLAVLPGYNQADVRLRVCAYLTTAQIPAPGCPNPSWVTVTDATVAVGGGRTVAVKRVVLVYTHQYAYIGGIMGMIGGGGSFQRTAPLRLEAVMRTELQNPGP